MKNLWQTSGQMTLYNFAESSLIQRVQIISVRKFPFLEVTPIGTNFDALSLNFLAPIFDSTSGPDSGGDF